MTNKQLNNELTNTSTKQAEVEIVQKEGISIIWFVPVIALIFGVWLAVKTISEQGVFITIEFDSGTGIIPKKTEVRYKGLVTGMVKSVVPSDDLQHVIAEIEMSEKFSDYLTENTLFWLISADISLQGVSGLDTLISGSYINILPDVAGTGASEQHFVALNEAPPIDMQTPGLHITLQADVLGSLSENSQVSFKQIPIGYVSSYRYVQNSKKVDINIFIEPEFAYLIKENSLFWNISGVNMQASLATGLKINTNSISSIISGGIAVDTLSYQAEKPQAQNGQRFTLHSDFQSAEMGYEIELALGWNSGVDNNASIQFQGVTIGQIESFTRIDPKSRKIIAKANVNPRIVPYLTDQSQFYIVAPKIDLTGISNASSLLTGAYISIRPSLIGEPSTSFNVFNNKPAYSYDEPGLHIMLTADDRSSLQIGSNVSYKQQVVGNIQAIETIAPDKHIIHLHILPEFKEYVSPTTHFWNNSGVKLSANLKGVDIEINSLQSILTGGISFDLGVDNKADKGNVNNGDNFHLYSTKAFAEQRKLFHLNVPATEQISRKTRIIFRGVEIGSIHKIQTDKNISQLLIGILPEYEYVLKEQSTFWLVKPTLSLSGLTDTEALLGGEYITLNVGNGEPASNFALLTSPPAKKANAEGLQLQLISDNAQVASSGSPISYRGIVVGQVDNVELAANAKNVVVNITIDEKYRHLVHGKVRFYNASGFAVTGGFSDFVVKTESVDAILRGGISFYNPKNYDANEFEQVEKSKDLLVQEKDIFSLYDNIDQAKNAGQAITIHFSNPNGLKINTKITYQDQEAGYIERLIFSKDTVGVTALVILNDMGSQFALSNTKFWYAEPEVGLVGTKNIDRILDGGSIAMISSGGEPKVDFVAEDVPPVIKQLPYGLNIKLTTKRLGSLRSGDPVLYRQVKVGEVIGVGLSNTADNVVVYINIAKPYMALVSNESKFWNTSGFRVEAGLFSGIKIDSESVETLLSGGIAFATPEDANEDEKVKQGHGFRLYQNLDEDWLEWQPKIDIAVH